MPDDYACQECGYPQEIISDGEQCPICGGNFVSLNEGLVSMDDHYNQDDDLESEKDGFSYDEGYSSI